MQSSPLIQSNQENHSKTSYLGLAVRVGGMSGWLGRLSTFLMIVIRESSWFGKKVARITKAEWCPSSLQVDSAAMVGLRHLGS